MFAERLRLPGSTGPQSSVAGANGERRLRASRRHSPATSLCDVWSSVAGGRYTWQARHSRAWSWRAVCRPPVQAPAPMAATPPRVAIPMDPTHLALQSIVVLASPIHRTKSPNRSVATTTAVIHCGCVQTCPRSRRSSSNRWKRVPGYSRTRGSGSQTPHLKRVEETGDGVHAFGCSRQPCAGTDDFTVRTVVARFERPPSLEGSLVSLTVDSETRVTFGAYDW